MSLVQVSNNGLMSFGRPFSSNAIEEFSVDFVQFHETIIAPYWGSYVTTNVNVRVSTERRDLFHILNLLSSSNPSFCDFQPTTVVVVTWENIATLFDLSTRVSELGGRGYGHTHITTCYVIKVKVYYQIGGGVPHLVNTGGCPSLAPPPVEPVYEFVLFSRDNFSLI